MEASAQNWCIWEFLRAYAEQQQVEQFAFQALQTAEHELTASGVHLQIATAVDVDVADEPAVVAGHGHTRVAGTLLLPDFEVVAQDG